jgi:hypothetical protein
MDLLYDLLDQLWRKSRIPGCRVSEETPEGTTKPVSYHPKFSEGTTIVIYLESYLFECITCFKHVLSFRSNPVKSSPFASSNEPGSSVLANKTIFGFISALNYSPHHRGLGLPELQKLPL